MNDGVMLFIIISAVLWLWWDSRGVAEKAMVAARAYCANAGVSFLNDAVAWKKLSLKRNRQGRLQLKRTYFFEFASDMQQRYKGEIVMLGHVVDSIQLEVFRTTD
jgi:hypothetical protein